MHSPIDAVTELIARHQRAQKGEQELLLFLTESLVELQYVLKSDVDDVMVVRRAIDRAIERARPGARETAARDMADHGLTDVQIETMRMVAEGLSNAEIAERRVVAVKSVENLIARIAKQLDIGNDGGRNQRVMITREYYRLIGAQGGSQPE